MITSNCSATSTLRAYLKALFAYAIVSHSIEADADAILDLYPGFAADVAEGIMFHFRAGQDHVPPYQDMIFDTDDSDSDVEPSSDGSSVVDSDCVMDESDSEDPDSLFADTSEVAQGPVTAPVRDLVTDSILPTVKWETTDSKL